MRDGAKQPKIDWEPIKAEYVTTNITKAKLAEKYGVSPSALQYRSGVEQWGPQRKAHRDRVLEQTSQRLSEAAAERMATLMGGTDKMLAAALEVLDDPQQFYRYQVKVKEDGETVTKEEIFQKADTKAMKEMTSLLEKLTGITRDLYGIPTREQELKQELAAEKLALEKRKSESGIGEQTRIEVVFDAGEEDWNV